MAWLTDINQSERITISNNFYYETQSHPTNPNWIQVREIQERVSEYRGLTKDAAYNEFTNIEASANYSRSYQYAPIGGGGYNLTMNERWIRTNWITLQPGESVGES